LIDTAQHLIPELDRPNLSWVASMPKTLAGTKTVLAGGGVEAGYDGLAYHVYGHSQLGDDGSGALHSYMLTATRKPLWITELGINAPGLDPAAKARRYLDFLSAASERIHGVAIWLIAQPG